MIKLSPDELRASASKYASSGEEVDSLLSVLRTEQATISSNWEGSGFAAFDEQFTALAPKIEEFAQLLRDIDTQLRGVAQVMEDTDNEISQRIRG